MLLDLRRQFGCAGPASKWHRSAIASGAPLAAMTIFLAVRRLPDVRQGQQLRRERIFVNQVPVVVQMFGLGQRTLAQLLDGFFHRIEGIGWLARMLNSTSFVKLLRQRSAVRCPQIVNLPRADELR